MSINKYRNERSVKKRQIAFARVRFFLLLTILAGSIYGITVLQKSSIGDLVINTSSYTQISLAPETNSDNKALVNETETNDNEAVKAIVTQPVIKDSYPIDMEINSKYAVVYDVQSNEVLFAKNAEEKCYPASTTKILSAAITYENSDEETLFTAGDELDFVNPGSSLAYLNRGSILDREMMIDAMMLPSGNDAAYTAAATIGRKLAGNENISAEKAVKYFVAEMNKKAKQIGAVNTHFANPDGFHDDNHYTTALDMLKISLYSTQIDGVMKSAGKPSRNVTFVSGEQIYWENSNKLIHDYSDCYYTYATGLKTGMTDKSGYCVIATAERYGHEVICVVMGGESSDRRWNDTIALLDQAFVCIKNSDG